MEENLDWQPTYPRSPLRVGRMLPYNNEPEPYTHPGDLLNYATWAMPNPLVAVYRAGAMGRAMLASAKKRSALRAALDPSEQVLEHIF